MKKILNLHGVTTLSKKAQKKIKGMRESESYTTSCCADGVHCWGRFGDTGHCVTGHCCPATDVCTVYGTR